VAVLDVATGVLKRHWGAYGNVPDDSPLPLYSPEDPPAQQFRSPLHCAEVSNDGLVYACDRASDRVQVFQTDGTFVREIFVEPETLGSGSAWDITFSPDAEQRFLYLADGFNRKVHVIERATMEVLTKFGDGGRQPGQFYGVHSIATDSQGNLYTTETYEGKRLQKFVFRGLGNVPPDQGVVWPAGNR
jgi:DNA-binding beta-propeller fold protein YncE